MSKISRMGLQYRGKYGRRMLEQLSRPISIRIARQCQNNLTGHFKDGVLGKILNGVFQFFPRFELNGIGCLDLDCFAGLGIPATAGFTSDF